MQVEWWSVIPFVVLLLSIAILPLVQAGGKRHAPQEGSWLDGVKKFFEDMKP